MAVLDASLLVASLLSADTHHAVAAEWLRDATARQATMRAPGIAVPEVAGAIRRATGQTAPALDVQRRLLSGNAVALEALTPSLTAEAAELAASLGLRGCDSIYVALAVELGDSLVTFDHDQAERARAVVEVVIPGAARG